jgi:hypothetical protein
MTISNNINLSECTFFKVAPRDIIAQIFSGFNRTELKTIALVSKLFFSLVKILFHSENNGRAHFFLRQLRPLIAEELFEKIVNAKEILEIPTDTIFKTENALLEFKCKVAEEFASLDKDVYSVIKFSLQYNHPRLEDIFSIEECYRELADINTKTTAEKEAVFLLSIDRLLRLGDVKTCIEMVKKIENPTMKKQLIWKIQDGCLKNGHLSLIFELAEVPGVNRTSILFNLFRNYLIQNDQINAKKCMKLLGKEKSEDCLFYLDRLNTLDSLLEIMKKTPSYQEQVEEFMVSFLSDHQNNPILSLLLIAKKNGGKISNYLRPEKQ